MNLGEIVTSVGNWLNRSDLTIVTPSVVQIVQLQLERQYNFQYMRRTDGAVTPSGDLISVPARYKSAHYLHVISSGTRYPLMKADIRYALDQYNADADVGLPTMYSLVNSVSGGVLMQYFQLRPYPDSTDYDYELCYFAKSETLSDPATSNWLTENAFDVLIFGALVKMSPYLGNDARIPVWQKEFLEALDGLVKEDKRESFEGSPMYVKPGVDVV